MIKIYNNLLLVIKVFKQMIKIVIKQTILNQYTKNYILFVNLVYKT